jgi:hypothetical protein
MLILYHRNGRREFIRTEKLPSVPRTAHRSETEACNSRTPPTLVDEKEDDSDLDTCEK